MHKYIHKFDETHILEITWQFSPSNNHYHHGMMKLVINEKPVKSMSFSGRFLYDDQMIENQIKSAMTNFKEFIGIQYENI